MPKTSTPAADKTAGRDRFFREGGLRGWVPFTTRDGSAVDDARAAGLPQPPDDRHAVARTA